MKSKIALIAVLLLLAQTVFGVGIRGQNLRAMVEYEPNKHIEFDYAVIANAGFTQDYDLRVVGDLAEHVRLDPPKVLALPDGQRSPFKASIDFPAELAAPGIHPLEIFVEETMVRGSGGSASAGANVGAKVAAVAQILVRVLYPMKKLVASLAIGDGEERRPLVLGANVENWGKTPFDKVWADFNVLDQNNSKIEMLRTKVIPLATLEQKQVTAVLDGVKYEAGEYRVNAIVYADEQREELNGTFRIGEMLVEIVEATATFKNSSINPFNIKVRSKWNRDIQNVYAIARIGPSEVQTPTVTLKPWEERVLTGYWDTTGFNIGEHEAYITLYFDGKTTTAKLKVEIIPGLEVQTERPVSTARPYVFGLLAIVAVLVIINVVLLLRLRKKE